MALSTKEFKKKKNRVIVLATVIETARGVYQMELCKRLQEGAEGRVVERNREEGGGEEQMGGGGEEQRGGW